MENKSLTENLMAITKEKSKLENKLQSFLHNKRLDAMKFNEYLAENQELKEEVSMLRKSLENINRDHSEKCKEVETVIEQNKTLKLSIEDLKKKITLLEQERMSFKRTTEELRKSHKIFLTNYGNEINCNKQLEDVQSVMNDCKRTINTLKKDITSVHLL